MKKYPRCNWDKCANKFNRGAPATIVTGWGASRRTIPNYSTRYSECGGCPRVTRPKQFSKESFENFDIRD